MNKFDYDSMDKLELIAVIDHLETLRDRLLGELERASSDYQELEEKFEDLQFANDDLTDDYASLEGQNEDLLAALLMLILKM